MRPPHVRPRLARQRISLRQRRTWRIRTDPDFAAKAAKAADIVGLSLGPTENAVVISVHEKPGIEALERAQGHLRMPDGWSLTGFAHEYEPHGSTTHFAALEVATGQVQTALHRRRRRRQFFDAMNEVLAAHPDTEICNNSGS